MIAPLPTPAELTAPPAHAARVCMNGHLLDSSLPIDQLDAIDVNRADPLSIRTSSTRCATCGAGSIVGCPCCGFPIPGEYPSLAYAVPHFCIVCGEFYPWTFRGEFYGTLAEILEETPRLDESAREHALAQLARLREGLAEPAELAALESTFAGLGGSDAQLAGEILDVVIPARAVARLS